MITKPNHAMYLRRRTSHRFAATVAMCGLAVLVGSACAARDADVVTVGSGRIEFEDGSNLEFDDVLELAFQPDVPSEADTVELSRWPLVYSPSTPARSIPLAWVAALDVTEYEADPACSCMRDVTLDVRTDNGVVFRTHARTLEWISVRTAGETRQVNFTDGGGKHIRKLVLE